MLLSNELNLVFRLQCFLFSVLFYCKAVKFHTYPLFYFPPAWVDTVKCGAEREKRGETETEKKTAVISLSLQRHDLHDKPLKPEGPAFSGLNSPAEKKATVGHPQPQHTPQLQIKE